MSMLIQKQFVELALMFACGMSIAALQQVLRLYQEYDRPGKGISAVQDMLFWCLAGLLTAAYLYRCSYGAISLCTFFAWVVGFFMWNPIGKKKLHNFFKLFYRDL